MEKEGPVLLKSYFKRKFTLSRNLSFPLAFEKSLFSERGNTKQFDISRDIFQFIK